MVKVYIINDALWCVLATDRWPCRFCVISEGMAGGLFLLNMALTEYTIILWSRMYFGQLNRMLGFVALWPHAVFPQASLDGQRSWERACR